MNIENCISTVSRGINACNNYQKPMLEKYPRGLTIFREFGIFCVLKFRRLSISSPCKGNRSTLHVYQVLPALYEQNFYASKFNFSYCFRRFNYFVWPFYFQDTMKYFCFIGKKLIHVMVLISINVRISIGLSITFEKVVEML